MTKQMSIVDPDNLRAVLAHVLRANGHECPQRPVRVAYVAREHAPAAYFITAPACCAAVLAAELAPVTGRLLLPHDSGWVFFHEEAQRIVTILGSSTRK